jgi:hypothetical protein
VTLPKSPESISFASIVAISVPARPIQTLISDRILEQYDDHKFCHAAIKRFYVTAHIYRLESSVYTLMH